MSFFKWKIKRRENLDNLITKERTIILDTSALNSNKGIEIIEEEGTKVILLTGTILEMDKWKHAKGTFGNNVRTISRKSREDEKSEKFICIAGYNKHSYQDKNIIDYCRDNSNVIILTADNNLCNMAKAFGISYIYVEEEKNEEYELEVEEIQEEEVVSSEEIKEVKKEYQNDIYFFDGSIRFTPKKGFYTSIRLETDNGIIDRLDTYKEGDFIYEILASKKGKYMEINKYQIVSKNDFCKAIKIYKHPIHYMNEIFLAPFSNEMQDEILKIYKEAI